MAGNGVGLDEIIGLTPRQTAGSGNWKGGNLQRVNGPQVGAVRYNKRDGGGHVALVVGINSDGTARCVSGNSSNSVKYVDYSGGEYYMPNYGSHDVQSVIGVAKSQVGYKEGAGNTTPFGAWSGANGNAWCGSFLGWCFSAAYAGGTQFQQFGDGSTEVSQGGWDAEGNYVGPGTGSGIGKGGTEFHGHIWGNSDLVMYYARVSNGATFPRENRAAHVTIHNAFAEADITSMAAMVESSGKCYNYGVDASGVIGLFADEQMWTASSDNSEADMFGINIIVSGGSNGFSSGALSSLTDLLEDIYRRNFLYLVTFNDNLDDTMTLHRQYNPGINCPGPAAEKQLRIIADEVNSRLSAKIQTNFVQVGSRLASSMANALRTQSIINIARLKPYVMIVDKDYNPKDLNMDVLYTSGVVALFIDIGKFDEDDHWNEKKVAKIISAINIEAVPLPFGMIFESKAKTVEDVRKEAYWLHFLVSKHPPKLGVWIEPDFKSKKKAPELLQAWYEFFVDWGLKSKCGIYATTDQLDDIGWPAQSNYMAMWLAGEMTDSVCPDDELLTPTFFQLGNLTNYGINVAAQAYWRSQSIGFDVAGEGGYWAPGPTDVWDENGLVYDGNLVIQGGDGSFVVKDVPQIMNGTPFKKYEGYAAITSQSSLQWKIQHSSSVTTDSQGFRRYGDRYIIAVGSAIADVGQYVDVKLQNGQTIKCIVGDRKADQHTDSQNIYTRGTNPCCSEFIVDTKKLDPAAKKAGNCSKTSGKNWDSPVVSFTVHNTYVSV